MGLQANETDYTCDCFEPITSGSHAQRRQLEFSHKHLLPHTDKAIMFKPQLRKPRTAHKGTPRGNRANSPPQEVSRKGDAVAAFRNSLHFNLVTLTNRLTTANSKLMLKNFGVGIASQYTLAVLMQESDVLPSRLCEITTMDKSVASRTLNSLEQSGWVTRESDPLDQRREFWNITPRGKEFFESFIPDVVSQLDLLERGFTKQERETLISLLWRLQDNLPLMQAYKAKGAKKPR